MPRTPNDAWRPRSSSLGYYFTCDYRAALDRLVADGVLMAPDRGDTSIMDFGTLAHYRWQRLLGARFPEGALAPPDHMLSDVAAALFKGDQANASAAIDKCAELAAGETPTLDPGVVWDAETQHDIRGKLTGHIDLLSSDYRVVVDLKTTSRPPERGEMKPEHFVQLVAYHILNKERTERAYILYVDRHGEWVMLSKPLLFKHPEHGEHLAEFVVQVHDYIRHLRSKTLAAKVVPRIGDHCIKQFCPYRDLCRDKLIPKGASKKTPGATARTAGLIQSLARPPSLPTGGLPPGLAGLTRSNPVSTQVNPPAPPPVPAPPEPPHEDQP